MAASLRHSHGIMECWNSGIMVKKRLTSEFGSRVLGSILTTSPWIFLYVPEITTPSWQSWHSQMNGWPCPAWAILVVIELKEWKGLFLLYQRDIGVRSSFRRKYLPRIKAADNWDKLRDWCQCRSCYCSTTCEDKPNIPVFQHSIIPIVSETNNEYSIQTTWS